MHDADIEPHARAALFRERLRKALAERRMSAAAAARAAGIDRSTLSQLLTARSARMPTGHALARLGRALHVTSDWLLGLADDPAPVAAILDASVQITDVPFAPADENLFRWLAEARGYKVRHVPLSLPSLMKTEAVLRHEYAGAVGRTSAQAIADSERRLAYARTAETDYEICFTRQALEGFALGHSIWRGLEAAARREQLEQMAVLLAELYPNVRVHLYDAHDVYAVPLTIFGPHRAAVYIGQSYLVFNARNHVRALTERFDGLIRAATIQAHEVAAFAASWANRVR